MKRAMKSGILTGVMLLLLSVTAWAAQWTTYDLKEVGIQIDIPTSYLVFTRDLEEDDPNLAILGESKEEMYDWMLQSDVYLSALHPQGNSELMVMVSNGALLELHQLSDAEFDETMSEVLQGMIRSGITDVQGESYQHHQTRMIKTSLSQSVESGIVYGQTYTAAYGGKWIHIMLKSYAGELNAAQKVAFKKVIDSIYFDMDAAQTQLPEASESASKRDGVQEIFDTLFLRIVLGFILTVGIYSFPIIIYRYVIRRAPVEKKKAKWITIIYGICAGIVMTVILVSTGGKGINGTAIVLWSGINYRMLIGGKKRRAISMDAPVVASSYDGKDAVQYCHHCGAQLVGDVLYCHKCGARIPEEEEK